jgi:hypothetical protein
MLVEAKTDIPWTKPEDIPLDEIGRGGLLEKESLTVSMTDVHITQFKPVTEERIRNAAVINDGK